MSTLWHVVKVENLAIFCVFDDDLRMQVAFVLDNHKTRPAAGIDFAAEGFAIDQVLKANLTASLRQNWNTVGIPFANRVACLHRAVFFDA